MRLNRLIVIFEKSINLLSKACTYGQGVLVLAVSAFAGLCFFPAYYPMLQIFFKSLYYAFRFPY